MTAPSSSSVLWAEWRRGLKDLQNVVTNPFNGITPTHEEPGTIGNPTPQLVTQDIQGKENFSNMLDRYAGRPAPVQEPQKERE